MLEQTTSSARQVDDKTRALSRPVLIVAVVVLVAFGGFVWFMIGQRDGSEVSWTRLAWLFASVEAIAFGAAGAVFGSSIQRERAEKAEESARQNADAAANGKALAAAVIADDPRTGGNAGLESLGPEGVSVASRHAAIARQLFP